MRTENSPLLAVAQPWEVERLAAYAVKRASTMAHGMTLGRPERAAALVKYYDGLCRSVGLDTVLTVCQSWHETGTWSSWWFGAPRRNPAGIGVTGAKVDPPPPAAQVWTWQPLDNGRYAKGHAFPSYASAAMSHVHGLALWAGANPSAVQALATRTTAAGARPYSPPTVARGSATTIMHLGWAYNPRHIGWAHPGHAPKLTAADAQAQGKTYGQAIARLARDILS